MENHKETYMKNDMETEITVGRVVRVRVSNKETLFVGPFKKLYHQLGSGWKLPSSY